MTKKMISNVEARDSVLDMFQKVKKSRIAIESGFDNPKKFNRNTISAKIQVPGTSGTWSIINTSNDTYFKCDMTRYYDAYGVVCHEESTMADRAKKILNLDI